MKAPTSVSELLSALVQIPSVNPDGDPGTDKVGEKACAEYLGEFLKSIGATVDFHEVLSGRPNVIGRFPGKTAKPRLLFAPHTDTVSIKGMVIDPFGGEVRDGKIWGRGSSDTKGPMASMLWAIRELGSEITELSHEVWFAGLVGEEAGQQGSLDLAAREKFDFVLAGEPTSLEAVCRSKGSAWFVLSMPGVASHGATPELGVNAIYKMADVVRYLRDEVVPELASVKDELLGGSTLSVGIIQGGSKTNIVPDECSVHVDVRLIPQRVKEEWSKTFKAQLQKRWPELVINEPKNLRPLETATDIPEMQKLKSLGTKFAGAPWFSDASIFSAAGSPAIAIGPGSIAQAHTKDEFIEVAKLEQGVEFFTRFLRSLK